MDLITVTTNEKQQQVVSARELHKGLEIKKRFSEWFKQYTTMFRENYDFMGVPESTPIKNGNGRIQYLDDYAISISMAKHIAMMTKTAKGFEYRDYFMELERKWNDPQEVVKRGYAILQNENTQLKLENSKLIVENQIMQPKAQYFDDLVDRNLLTNFRDTAKMLKMKQKEFVNFLLDKKYIFRDKKGKLMPYQQYNNVLFQIKESKGLNWEGVQTLVTPKGRETFNILLNN
ncbi:phage antirepressor KilAC domain-containing protein [Streptococcus agalactiae]|uniref:phage antirepressor KilAC domain-containing protein n=1 Tax=Streptococcus agalactiae TaxID=1311 RepID=UPI001CCE9C70|nr:phage antirepressor KilAC domain-containing protein [Streptococcus agalactiae]